MNETISCLDGLEAVEHQWLEAGKQLHDRLAQNVAALCLSGEQVLLDVEAGRTVPAETIAHFRLLLEKTSDEVKFLQEQLVPPPHDPYGLIKALERLATLARSRVPCELEIDSAVRVEDYSVALLLYRIAQRVVNRAIDRGASKLSIRIGHLEDAGKLQISHGGLDGTDLDPILLGAARTRNVEIKNEGSTCTLSWRTGAVN